MIFEVPLADGRVVYMEGFEGGVYSTVWVCPQKFYAMWHDSQKLDIKRTQKWYSQTEISFANSIDYPIEMTSAEIYDYDGQGILKVKLRDAITRTTWLLKNGAYCFPLFCSPARLPLFLMHLSIR